MFQQDNLNNANICVSKIDLLLKSIPQLADDLLNYIEELYGENRLFYYSPGCQITKDGRKYKYFDSLFEVLYYDNDIKTYLDISELPNDVLSALNLGQAIFNLRLEQSDEAIPATEQVQPLEEALTICNNYVSVYLQDQGIFEDSKIYAKYIKNYQEEVFE